MKVDQTNIEAIEGFMNDFSIDGSDFGDEDGLYELYDQMLDECCSCETCNRGGSDLKEEDPIAYRCGFSDWTDSECQSDNLFYIDGQYLTVEQMEELKEAIKDAIDELF